jgi:hypothetical protein
MKARIDIPGHRGRSERSLHLNYPMILDESQRGVIIIYSAHKYELLFLLSLRSGSTAVHGCMRMSLSLFLFIFTSGGASRMTQHLHFEKRDAWRLRD